jgi:hypothetical protein
MDGAGCGILVTAIAMLLSAIGAGAMFNASQRKPD